MATKIKQARQQKIRDDLTGEHSFGDAGQIILACLFTVIWIADTFFFEYTTILNNYVPYSIRIPFGAFLLIMSGYLAKSGLSIVFGEKREEPCVIRKSVFNFVRHPIYLGEILLYLGFVIMSISLAAVFVLSGIILFLYYISRYEEKLLLARFGEDYSEYMRDVPMLLPRLRRR